jgi:hypothetical protein
MPVALLAAAALAASSFPATTPAQVIALASQPRVTAFVATYDVINHQSSERLPAYRVRVARWGGRYLYRADFDHPRTTTWFGFTIGASPQPFGCIVDWERSEPPECGSDPFGAVLAMGFMLPVLATEKPFRPLVAKGGVVRQRTHLARKVSCLYARRDRRQLCAGRSGIATVVITDTTYAVADSLRLRATAKDVRPPARIQPPEE